MRIENKDKPVRIGIIGGGQLARMSAFQAIRMGFEIAILEKEKNSPAGQLTKHEFAGWVDDEEILRAFADSSDIVTLENEFVDAGRLALIESWGKIVLPSSASIALIQDKFLQKETLRNAGIPVAPFVAVSDEGAFPEIAKTLSLPFMLKSRKMGYDGYGNALIRSEDDFHDAFPKLGKRHAQLMAEAFIPFEKELAVMAARTGQETIIYPVVETIQEHHICKIVKAPAQVSDTVLARCREIASASVEAIRGIGIFGIELFLCSDGSVLVNEMAPRPHNSGHYTIEGCVTSQFENHIRAVLGLPLGSAELVRPAAVMVNLLGKREGAGFPANYDESLREKDIHLHIYGKAKSRIGRKMGHITAVGDSIEDLIRKAIAIEKIINL